METEKTGYERALELIEECRLTRSTILDLRNLELNKIPIELFEFYWLEELFFYDYYNYEKKEFSSLVTGWSSNEIKKLPNLFKKLKNLKVLYLSNTNRIGIGSFQTADVGLFIYNVSILQNLVKLEELSLHTKENKKLEVVLNKLKKLRILSVRDSNLKNLNFAIHLDKIQILDVAENQIKNITPLNNKRNLHTLIINNNKLKDISPLHQLKKIKILVLSWNQIQDLTVLENLNQLNTLEISSNKIKNFSPIKKTTNIQHIALGNLNISNLSFLKELKKLETLNAWSNKISDISLIKQLKNITHLFLEDNLISDISTLRNLKKLEILNLAENTISDISAIDNLRNLQTLNLKSTQITEIRILKNLQKLNTLNLSYTQIEDISPIIPFLKNKKLRITLNESAYNRRVSLKDCPLKNPPIEIVEQGTEAILRYFEDIKNQGIAHLYEAKTLIIGKAGVGKTSLRYKLKDQKCQLPEDNESTKGIDIAPMTFPVPKENREFNVNIWDFGGQEIYHNTHQFFLTKRSLYVLVADYRTEKHEINYWLQIVEMMGGGSPLLIVQNEKDNRVGDLNLPGLKSQYSEIYKDDFRVDLRAICEGEHHKKESEKAFQQLQTEIQSKLLQLPHIGDVLPKQWVVIRKEIEKLAAQKAYISEDEFYNLCAKHQITDNQKQRDLSQYFHDLGVFLHFQNEDKPSALSEIVILQNTWATEAVYKVLDSTLVKDEQFGRFTYKDLKQIWQDSTWRSKAKELLELMMEFQLCYQIGETAEYIAPQLLPAQQPDYPWAQTNNLQLRYRYGFMPKGIITRFIVKMHKYIAEGQTLVWKEGVILEYQDAKAEVIETYRDNEIHIRVSGSRGKELLTIIAHNIDELNDAFEKMRVDKLVPCNCDECKGLAIPNFYEYSDLDRRRKKGKRTIECKISYDDIDVLKLIDDVFIDRYGDKEEIKRLIRKPDLKRAIRLLENMIEQDSPEANDLLVIQGNFNDNLNRFHQGSIKEDDYRVERAKTATALLNLLNNL